MAAARERGSGGAHAGDATTNTGVHDGASVRAVRRRLLFGLMAAIAVASARPAGATAAAVTPVDGAGLHVLSSRQLDPRLLEVRVSTPDLRKPADVRILLPEGYDARASRRYPVLYLLHGTSGGASDWTTMGDAEETTAGQPLIVVMPDIALGRDGGGWCSDWVNGRAYGPPRWETFHVDELIPWVDRNLQTVAERDGRAIAGLSQGGFCSMSYAARHPDLFAAALAYSGAPDIATDPTVKAGATAVINATEVGLDGVPANSIFGDRATNEINWAAHDPTTLAGNLRGMRLLLFSGTGTPGPLDPPGPPNPGATGIEAATHLSTESFHRRLGELGIPSSYDSYGPGTHTWPYWARDLRRSIAPLMDAFAHPPRPVRVDYKSADAEYEVFGWRVAMQRGAREFSRLADAGPDGFSLSGSGRGVVDTPAVYTPGRAYRVAVSGDGDPSTGLVEADAAGRLRVGVGLGPARPAVRTARVTIAAVSASAAPTAQRRRCLSRRAITIHVRRAPGARVRVRVNGRPAKVRVRAGTVRIDLSGRRAGSYRVSVRVAGRTTYRTYRTCRA